MRTIYVIGKPLKFKKDKHNSPIMLFTGQELLTALDDTNPDQLRLFHDWVDADHYLYLHGIPDSTYPPQFSATPIYTVKLPESQVCEIKESAIKESEIKETTTSISAKTTRIRRVGRPPAYTPPGCEVITSATESYISAKVIRNKIIGFDFGSKSIIDDRNHFPEAEKLTATIAYFEEETSLRKDPRYSQGGLFAEQSNQSRKAKLPELKPAELYPLLSSVFDEMYPSEQLSKEEAVIFYQVASKVVREQHDRMYQKNWNWSAFFTFICCIPLVTLPFVSLIFDSILEKISESDSIQNKKISTASASTLSKINILPADATLHKNNLFNKHGELRKIKNGDSSEWLGTAGQMRRL